MLKFASFFSRLFEACKLDGPISRNITWVALLEKNESTHANASKCCMVCRSCLLALWSLKFLVNGLKRRSRLLLCMWIDTSSNKVRCLCSSYFCRSSVIGLYTSDTAPIFLHITHGRGKLAPGPFSLGPWAPPVSVISVAWVSFIVVMPFSHSDKI